MIREQIFNCANCNTEAAKYLGGVFQISRTKWTENNDFCSECVEKIEQQAKFMIGAFRDFTPDEIKRILIREFTGEMSFVIPPQHSYNKAENRAAKELAALFNALEPFLKIGKYAGEIVEICDKLRWILDKNLKAEGWRIIVKGNEWTIKPPFNYYHRRAKAKSDN